MLSSSAYLKVITRSKDIGHTHFLRARYTLPKSRVSGKGLAFAISGSISGVSHFRNLVIFVRTSELRKRQSPLAIRPRIRLFDIFICHFVTIYAILSTFRTYFRFGTTIAIILVVPQMMRGTDTKQQCGLSGNKIIKNLKL